MESLLQAKACKFSWTLCGQVMTIYLQPQFWGASFEMHCICVAGCSNTKWPMQLHCHTAPNTISELFKFFINLHYVPNGFFKTVIRSANMR